LATRVTDIHRPAPIIDELNAQMNTALKDPKLLENFNSGALEAIGGSPHVIGTLARADSEKYAVRAAHELVVAGIAMRRVRTKIARVRTCPGATRGTRRRDRGTKRRGRSRRARAR
jgi:hypothetical protein